MCLSITVGQEAETVIHAFVTSLLSFYYNVLLLQSRDAEHSCLLANRNGTLGAYNSGAQVSVLAFCSAWVPFQHISANLSNPELSGVHLPETL